MKKEYKKINETLYSEVLPNGLTGLFIAKTGISQNVWIIYHGLWLN